MNACYAKAVMGRGHLLLHASAVSAGGRTVALAGPPGAGKSTAALTLVERGYRFLSNDRVLALVTDDGVEALGYPKQPRVNPGTLLHHPRLRGLLEPADQAALARLSRDELWALERKADVDLDAIYGPGTVELSGRMQALVLFRWRPGGEGLSVRPRDARDAIADLPLFRKDLGPFDLDRPTRAALDEATRARYRRLLERVRVVEVSGRVDLDRLAGLVGELLID